MSNGVVDRLTRIRYALCQCGVGGLLWLSVSCSGETVPVQTPEEVASVTARACYEALYNGNPEVFLNNRIGVAAMSQDYREQLLQNYRLHATQVMRAHRGVRAVEVSRAMMDTTLQTMQVFLSISYNDGTQEEIVTALVENDGQWLLK